jgi:hypothetical protein
MALAFRHAESGDVHIVADADGYGVPDWEALPEPPEGPCEWDGAAWAIDLAPMKRALTDAVNVRAEAVRCLFLTPGSGQAITYARKEAEARAWTAEADAGAFPFLSAEAIATGATLADTAALVLAQANAWVSIGAAIEGNRRGHVVAIDAAPDVASLEAINPDAGWPSA